MDDTLNMLMLKFLELGYPTRRLRWGSLNQFKRVIITERKMYLLSNAPDTVTLQEDLINIVKLVFSANQTQAKNVVKRYLNQPKTLLPS